jgi:hypothetical protein
MRMTKEEIFNFFMADYKLIYVSKLLYSDDSFVNVGLICVNEKLNTSYLMTLSVNFVT